MQINYSHPYYHTGPCQNLTLQVCLCLEACRRNKITANMGFFYKNNIKYYELYFLFFYLFFNALHLTVSLHNKKGRE